MVGNYVNRLGGVCGTGTERSTLPETEPWTQVILQAINDLNGRTALAPGSAQVLLENGLPPRVMG
jgi:hypothetical protein